MKICGYYVTKGGKPCAFKNVIGSHRCGILVPDTPVAFFHKRRDARRAINRSEAAAARFHGSLIEEWARKKVPAFFDGTEFKIQPLAKQA
jgi:hypothetical protein